MALTVETHTGFAGLWLRIFQRPSADRAYRGTSTHPDTCCKTWPGGCVTHSVLHLLTWHLMSAGLNVLALLSSICNWACCPLTQASVIEGTILNKCIPKLDHKCCDLPCGQSFESTGPVWAVPRPDSYGCHPVQCITHINLHKHW